MSTRAAPARASALAVAAPMPREAPVTSAVRPRIRSVLSLILTDCKHGEDETEPQRDPDSLECRGGRAARGGAAVGGLYGSARGAEGRERGAEAARAGARCVRD